MSILEDYVALKKKQKQEQSKKIEDILASRKYSKPPAAEPVVNDAQNIPLPYQSNTSSGKYTALRTGFAAEGMPGIKPYNPGNLVGATLGNTAKQGLVDKGYIPGTPSFDPSKTPSQTLNMPWKKNAAEKTPVEAPDPMLQAAAIADLLAAEKEKELADYLASDDAKNKSTNVTVVQGPHSASAAGSYIGSLLGNLLRTGNAKGDTKKGQIEQEIAYFRGISEKARNQHIMQKDLAEYETWPEADKDDMKVYYTSLNAWGVPDMRGSLAEDRLANKYGKETFKRIAESYVLSQNRENMQQITDFIKEHTTHGDGLLAIPIGIAGDVFSATDYIGQYAKTLFGGTTGRYAGLDTNAPGQMLSNVADVMMQEEGKNFVEMSQATASNLGADEKTAEAIGKIANTVYGAGMSALENITKVAATGGVGTLALAATAGFSQGVKDATLNGASSTQAILMGIVNGATEVLTEKLSLDNLMGAMKNAGSIKGFKAILLEALKHGGIEVSEEEANFLAGLVGEAIILQEKSGYNTMIRQLMAQGVPYAEAVSRANKALIEEAGQTAIQSALSGFMMSAGSNIVSGIGSTVFADNAQQYEQDKQSGQEALQNVLDGILPDRNTEQAETKKPAVGAQGTQDGAQNNGIDISDVLDETIAQGNGAPADPVNAAVESFGTTGNISNKMATDILNSAKAVQQLVKEAGMPKLEGMTVAQKRQAVKDAVKVMAENKVQEESTSVNTDPEQHTAQEQAIIDAYQEAVDDNLVAYIEAVKENPAQKMPRYPLKDVGTRAANDIKRITGIDVEGNKTQLEKRIVEHIIKDHGESGSTDQSMRDVNDIARIQYVLDNYDSVETGGKSSAYVYQNEHGRNVGAQTVVFKKKVNGTYFVVEAVPDSNKKTVFINSAYMSKNGENKSAASLSGNAEATRITSENATKSTADLEGAIAPKPIIRNDSEVVNSENGAVGAAERNFSGKAQYQDLLYEGNVQRDREGDVRPMEIPKTDSFGRNVSEFAGNAYGAEVTPDSMANVIEELVQEGALGFDRKGNAESLNEAAKEIKDKGASVVKGQISRAVADGKIKDGDIEKAMILYASYANSKRKTAQDSAAEMFVDLTMMAHMTGRNLQLFKLLRRMTPEGKLMAVKQAAQRSVNNTIKRRGSKEGVEVEIPTELEQQYLDAARAAADQKLAAAEDAQYEAEQAIYKYAASQLKATFKEKWDAWRYMAMLGNLKTQGRNIAGNAAFLPLVEVKNKISAVAEMALPKDQRTKAVFQDKELLAWAKKDATTRTVQDALKYSAKAGDNRSGAFIQENRTIFETQWLENYRKLTNNVTQGGDILFKNGYYARSLASFLKAQGYSAADVKNNAVSEQVMGEARAYAVQEAMKATFNDSNTFSDMISSIGFKNPDNIWKKAANIAAEGILPFRKTPANIVVRFAEYSPIGLARGAWNMVANVKNGKVTAAAAIDQLASGLTGTCVAALGWMLASGICGVALTGSDVDEDEKREGHQTYALEFSVNGKLYSYKIDWLAPTNLPLFLGVNLHNAIAKNGDSDLSVFGKMAQATLLSFEPMLQLSCLSSVNEVVEGARYAKEGEALYTIAADIVTSYFTQGIPALARQAGQAAQQNKRTTFANSDDPAVRDLQQLGASIPFVGEAFKIDKIDAWGEKEKTGGLLGRLVNAFVNPGTLKVTDIRAADQEIARLNESQSKNVTPPEAPKKISYTDKNGVAHKDVRLTEEQYAQLAELQGTTQAELVAGLIASDDYQAMTDEQRAAAIDYMYTIARERARSEVLEDYEPTAKWPEEAKSNEIAYVTQKAVKKSIEDAFAVGSTELDAAYSTFEGLSDDAQSAIEAEASGKVGYFLAAKGAGVETGTFLELYQKFDTIRSDITKTRSQQATEWAHTLNRAAESGTISKAQADTLRDKMMIWGQYPVQTQKYDEMTAQGISADAANDITWMLEGLEPLEGKKAVAYWQTAEAIGSANISDEEKYKALLTYGNDTQDENLKEMLAEGYSASDYAAALRIYSENKKQGGKGTKDRIIRQLRQELKLSKSAAEAIYKIYNSKSTEA